MAISISGKSIADSTSGIRPEATAARGLFMGSVVKEADDPMSLLAKAAEDLSSSFTETEECSLEERKTKSDKKRARNAERLIVAIKKLPDNPGRRSRNAMRRLARLFQARNNLALRELLEALGNELDDPLEQFLALVELKEEFGSGHRLAGTVDEALEHLAESRGDSIAAGISADMAAPAFAELDDAEPLRGLYRDAVADFATPRQAFTRILEQYGPGRLDMALDFLMSALGNDLSSARPSAESARLKALTGDLGVVRVLGAVFASCGRLLERLSKIHGIAGSTNAENLLDAVLTMRDNPYAGPHDVQGIVTLAKVPDTEREILFLQDFLHNLRELPDLFYTTVETRLRLLEAAQGALDEAIRREEEELGF